MNVEDLYKQYYDLHQKTQNGCKSTCGVMHLIRQIGVDPGFSIHVGGYCFGQWDRWECIGEGQTEAIALAQASKRLRDFERQLTDLK